MMIGLLAVAGEQSVSGNAAFGLASAFSRGGAEKSGGGSTPIDAMVIAAPTILRLSLLA